MYNNEQKLKLHKVVLEHKNTLLGMDNCVGGCDETTCKTFCTTSTDKQVGINVIHANIYRIMNGMA